MKGLFLDNTLSLNVAAYFIEWEDLQVATATEIGSLPIIGNGSKAESKGLEIFGRWVINENWELAWTYAYTNAELTEDAPGLVGPFNVRDGARLPGHAEHQGTVNVTYSTYIFEDWGLDINYGVVYSGDVLQHSGW